MSTQPKIRLTPEEYLRIERQARYKSGYFDGEVYAMTGASRRHNLICGNLYASIHAQLRRRPCEVYSSEMRVKVVQNGLYTYPDVVVVCGEPQFEDAHVDTLLNPLILIEVLSPSTEGYDRGAKAQYFRQIPSLTEYLLISQDKPHVEHYVRQADHHWLLSETDRLEDVVTMAAIGCQLALADLYEKLTFLEGQP